ncbi:MAG TPA: hypothetical protein VE153_22210 [Myxococcus sp.]|nr:hypothetical protein [Myxococcus sp.]
MTTENQDVVPFRVGGAGRAAQGKPMSFRELTMTDVREVLRRY